VSAEQIGLMQETGRDPSSEAGSHPLSLQMSELAAVSMFSQRVAALEHGNVQKAVG
jgi:hypothetical protein